MSNVLISLSNSYYKTDGSSDKEYHVKLELEATGSTYSVLSTYGRRGRATSTKDYGTGLSLKEALDVYDKIESDRKKSRYTTDVSGVPSDPSNPIKPGVAVYAKGAETIPSKYAPHISLEIKGDSLISGYESVYEDMLDSMYKIAILPKEPFKTLMVSKANDVIYYYNPSDRCLNLIETSVELSLLGFDIKKVEAWFNTAMANEDYVQVCMTENEIILLDLQNKDLESEPVESRWNALNLLYLKNASKSSLPISMIEWIPDDETPEFIAGISSVLKSKNVVGLHISCNNATKNSVLLEIS